MSVKLIQEKTKKEIERENKGDRTKKKRKKRFVIVL